MREECMLYARALKFSMLYHACMRQQGQEGQEEKSVVYGLTEGLVGFSTVISSVLKHARSQTLYRLLGDTSVRVVDTCVRGE